MKETLDYLKMTFSVTGNVWVDFVSGIVLFLILYSVVHKYILNEERIGGIESKLMLVVLNTMFNIVIVVGVLGIFRAIAFVKNLFA
ncbi:MAG: hypothetical protein EOM59_05705 [Clostridia bacterium]|nr:hypothetical protein [Clostridia bacterium]